MAATIISAIAPHLTHSQALGERNGPTIRIESGELIGVQNEAVRSFLGIPYAAPPVGQLRWQAPHPVEKWQGVRSAQSFGPACMQPATIGGMPLPKEFTPMSEDCLYLNVWTPANTKERLPVLFWIHGSGFMFGAGRGFGIDGSSFAKNGVVVVSLNYRLGLFGQFAHPALKSETAGSNYALLDLLAALRWVKQNIASFDGDPNQVTIGGLSAGASYSAMLLTLPEAKGLFHQVISQSGPLFYNWPTLDQAEQRGAQALEKALPSATAQALRALPADVIAMATDLNDLRSPRPIIDRKVLRDHPARMLAAGRFNARRVMVGSTNYEGVMRAMSPTPPSLSDEQLIATLGMQPERIQELYDPPKHKTPKQIAVDIEGDRTFTVGARYLARAMTQAGAPAYRYQFSYVPETLRGRLPGASHGSDQHFVFNQIENAMMWGRQATVADKATAQLIHGYWIAFIKSGDPNGERRPKWPRYDTSSDALLEFAASGPTVVERHWKERLDAVEATLLREIELR
jgi:para-nitrobenzyl esterase